MAEEQVRLFEGTRGGGPKRMEGARSDPLTPAEASALLAHVDHVRDPLHGDIWITALERFLIDTPEFQRLRNVNQLAMTYIVYPGALHTRFLHSIGTLHVCGQMIATCNRNAQTYAALADPQDVVPLAIPPYPALLARLCALLHDLAHVPFGHTLEKEGRVFLVDEWQDPERQERLLGREASLVGRVVEFLSDRDLSAEAAYGLIADIRDALSTKHENAHCLPYPFVHDLVSNTICADLIDYVQRDAYFCGLTEDFGKRFLEYLAVMPVEKAVGESDLRPVSVDGREAFASAGHDSGPIRMCRLTLLQYRYNERRAAVTKHDIVEEAIDLVRRRLGVAEKLYFHRTKLVASAMLIAAAQSHQLKADEIFELSDAEVLKLLEGSENRRAQQLGARIRNRKLFKPLYRVTFHPVDESNKAQLLWDASTGAYPRFSDPKTRLQLIERLEALIGRAVRGNAADGIGTVAISCPDRRMNLKAFDMLVLPSPNRGIRRLQETDHPTTRKEIEAIQDTHEYLWRLEVYVDPEVVRLSSADPFTCELAGAIQHEIGPRNEIPGFEGVQDQNLDELETRYFIKGTVRALGVEDQITQQHFEAISQQRFRGEGDAAERIEQFLREKGYGV